MKKAMVKVLLCICVFFIFVFSVAITVPPVPSEVNEAVNQRISLWGPELAVFIFLSIIYAQLFIMCFSASLKSVYTVIYIMAVSVGILSIRSLGWYLGDLSCYGYLFHNLFLASFFYIIISLLVYFVLLKVNMGKKSKE